MRGGFTLIEILAVLVIMGIMLSVAVPRMRPSQSQKVRAAAQQLVRGLELARTRALGTKRSVQVVFDVAGKGYIAYLDDNGDGIFAETAVENAAMRGFPRVDLEPDVTFGRGSATTALPGDTTTSGAVSFTSSRLKIGPNGITVPFGTGGTVYFVSKTKPNVVAGVSVTGAGSFKMWRYAGGGTWQ